MPRPGVIYATEAVTAAREVVERDSEMAGTVGIRRMLGVQSQWWYLAPAGLALVLPSPPFFLPLPLQLGLSHHCQEHVWLKKLHSG